MKPTSPLRRTVLLAVRVIAAVYVLLCVLIYIFQDRMVYFPSAVIETTPQSVGLESETIEIPAPDGNKLAAWLITATDAHGVILFCHGNGGNISHRLELARLFQRVGFSTLLFDYRGYGQSTGKPSEQNTYEDAVAAWDFLTIQKKIEPAKIVIWGESLGGGVASWLASSRLAGALVMQSTFTSIADMAQELYPIFPARVLTRIKYRSKENLSRVKIPVLVIHSRGDELIPYHHGEALFQAASEPKQFLEIRGDHNSGMLSSGPAVEAGLLKFFAKAIR